MRRAYFALILVLMISLVWGFSVASPALPSSAESVRPVQEIAFGDQPVGVFQAAASFARYEVVDLGQLDNLPSNSYAWKINEAGQVIGRDRNVDGYWRGFLWQDGTMVDLGTLGGTTGQALGLNDLGMVVGESRTAEGDSRATRWYSDTIVSLGTVYGGDTKAYAVNDAGQIVGEDRDGIVARPILWENGAVTDLCTWGCLEGVATAINDKGQIAGQIETPAGDFRAALWYSGVITELGTLGGGDSSAWGINSLGQVVGRSDITGDLESHAALWYGGVITDLGTLGGDLSVAIGINDLGQAVGFSRYDVSNRYLSHAFLWQDGRMVDLNDLIDPSLDIELRNAYDINNQGQIVGEAYRAGYGTFPFLLNPKPWTFLLYLAGDSNLSITYPPIVNRLEKVANNPAVNLVAFWDGTPAGDTAYYHIQYDTDMANLAAYVEGVTKWSFGELDSGSWVQLADFVSWGLDTFPAENVALLLSDHGSGLAGGLYDYTSGSYMSLAEMQFALSSALSWMDRDRFQVLYMDMCLMGMLEDAYQFRDLTETYVASEHIQWAFSEPYEQYVSGISHDSTAVDVAQLFAASYGDVAEPSGKPYTISATDIGALPQLITATNTLAQELDARMETISDTLQLAAETAQRYDNEDPSGTINNKDTYVDLWDLAAWIYIFVDDATVRTAATAVKDAVDAYVIAEGHGSSADVYLGRSHGVSIFFPATKSSFYSGANYDFAAGTNWEGGGAGPLYAVQETHDWGTMLVRYFGVTQPGGPDDATPPELVARGIPNQVFIPIILRGAR